MQFGKRNSGTDPKLGPAANAKPTTNASMPNGTTKMSSGGSNSFGRRHSGTDPKLGPAATAGAKYDPKG